jgi:hypothetical protein
MFLPRCGSYGRLDRLQRLRVHTVTHASDEEGAALKEGAASVTQRKCPRCASSDIEGRDAYDADDISGLLEGSSWGGTMTFQGRIDTNYRLTISEAGFRQQHGQEEEAECVTGWGTHYPFESRAQQVYFRLRSQLGEEEVASAMEKKVLRRRYPIRVVDDHSLMTAVVEQHFRSDGSLSSMSMNGRIFDGGPDGVHDAGGDDVCEEGEFNPRSECRGTFELQRSMKGRFCCSTFLGQLIGGAQQMGPVKSTVGGSTAAITNSSGFRFIIAPGNGGCGADIKSSNWYAWLDAELCKRGHESILVNWPDPEICHQHVWIPFVTDELKVDRRTIIGECLVVCLIQYTTAIQYTTTMVSLS